MYLGTDDVYIAERLFSSSLVAIVTQSAPRKLKVCHFKKGTEICNYSYTSKILAVKMNRAVIFYLSFIKKCTHCQVSRVFFIAISGMSRGVPLHPQYPGHESIAHHP